MIIVKRHEYQATAKSFLFSGGEVQTTLPPMQAIEDDITIIAHLESPQSIIELMMVNEIVERHRVSGKKKLIVPYFPYARQDRVMAPWEAFSLKPICALINSMNFDEVLTYDAHSEVTAALVDKIQIVKQVDIIQQFHGVKRYIADNNPVIIAPDAGAAKKALQIAQKFDLPLITASKIRDVKDGSITGTTVEPFDLHGRSVLIPDDICDGGKTFTELAKALRARGAKHIALYVTHGIFSKGFDVFDGLIDAIYTTSSLKSGQLPQETNIVTLNKYIITY